MFKDHSRPEVLEQPVPSASTCQDRTICSSSPDSLAPVLRHLRNGSQNPHCLLALELNSPALPLFLSTNWEDPLHRQRQELPVLMEELKDPQQARPGARTFAGSAGTPRFPVTSGALVTAPLQQRLCCSSCLQLLTATASLPRSVTTSPPRSSSSPPHATVKSADTGWQDRFH